jgi:hypothetical protein
MLERGTSELDERQADLTVLSTELGEREARVKELELELEERRRELGAVELKRAALERREASVAEREASLAAREEAQATSVLRSATDEKTPLEGPHLLFFPGERYALVERVGPVPTRGVSVLHEDAAFVVVRIGRSPLPDDIRPCVFLTS